MNAKRSLARAKLKAKGIPESNESIVFTADVPYEDTIRKLLRDIPLKDALGVVEVADGVAHCPKCHSLKTTEYTVQTRSGDEGGTSFYECTQCQNSWKG